VLKVHKASRDFLVLLALKAHKEPKVSKVKQVLKVLRVHKVSRVFLAQLDLKAHRVLKVSKVR